jgi:outer membrane biosynthesis protein TonB
LLIDSDGSIAKVDLVSDPGQGLGAAGVRAIRAFRFRPGKLNGRPVATSITYTLHFLIAN